MNNKVMLVVLDGLGHDTALAHCGYLESLARGGKARRYTMRSVLPSLSAPIYETLHTGIEPHEHGITSNDNLRPSSSEHVFGIARRHGRSTAAVAHSYFSVLYNGAPYDPLRDQETDDPERPVQHGRFYMQVGKTRWNIGLASEADLMTQASILVHRHAPDYLLLHSSACDSVGHLYGGESSEYQRQAHAVDDALAQHVPMWREHGYRVLVTADHGMSAIGWHGGTTDDVCRVAFHDIGHPQPGVHGEEVSQLSVAPTVLALMGLPQPVAMRARALP